MRFMSWASCLIIGALFLWEGRVLPLVCCHSVPLHYLRKGQITLPEPNLSCVGQLSPSFYRVVQTVSCVILAVIYG